MFNAKLVDISISKGKAHGVLISAPSGIHELPASSVLLAIGHSARETFRMLERVGVLFQPKPYAVGVRIEHSQDWLNKAQYGKFHDHPALGPAEYKLAAHLQDSDVYTFCMCPGGSVVAAASESGGVVTNGMSAYARDGMNCNAAILVSMKNDTAMFGGSPMKAFEYLESLERAAFKLGGGGFKAPAQLVSDFLARRPSKLARSIYPTYARGVAWCELDACLPAKLLDALRIGLTRFERQLPGFATPDAVLTAVESRSTCPVKMIRNASYGTSVGGVFAAGEGSGYAGGIVSSAVDGMRAAEAIMTIGEIE